MNDRSGAAEASTPVVLIVYNRPDHTREVLDFLRPTRPDRVFVIADGPKPDVDGDDLRCREVREALARGIDWPCEISRDFAERNLGLRRRVISGLDWVFSQVRRAIILEDDCRPDPTFFGYAEALLERYAEDERVMTISGDNFQGGRRRTPHSYYFSRYFHCSGWATWREVWDRHDPEMSEWPSFRDGGWLRRILDSRRAVSYWKDVLQRTYEGSIDSWAYSFLFAHWKEGSLCALPEVNLVKNVGFGPEGTHTSDRDDHRAEIPTAALPPPLDHPPFLVRHVEADRFTERVNFSGSWPRHLYREARRAARRVLTR